MIDMTNVLEVYEVTAQIKQLLESNIGIVNVKGEISNLSQPTSGHLYFSLKDERSLIRCVFFTTYNRSLSFEPKNGDTVVVTGKISLYEKSGQYQINVTGMFPFGIGLLLAQFEQLKEKLRKEGLFDTTHKRPLPTYPRTIGIITSETGAVLQDMTNIISRRFPVQIELFPAMVQGNEAAKTLTAGINYFSHSSVDAIIIGRGGGSFEDLFCFNDEGLARAIYACQKPVVSAVGHETDFTICDFVADVRASTPSVAAELVVPDRAEVANRLQHFRLEFANIVQTRINTIEGRLTKRTARLKALCDTDFIYTLQQRLDHAKMSLLRLKARFEDKCHDFERLQARFKGIRLNDYIIRGQEHLSQSNQRLSLLLRERVNACQQTLQRYKELIEAHNPKRVLERGYSYVEKGNVPICSVTHLTAGDAISILFKDGRCKATVDQ